MKMDLFLSLRTKNNRLEGKWNVKEYKYERIDPYDATQNESQILNGGIMTYTSYQPVYNPWTGSITGYNPVTTSVPYQQTMVFIAKDNTCALTTVSNGNTETSTSFWSWSDGASEQEILEIDGQGFIIKRLTNKEMELSLEFKEDGSTGTLKFILEKDK